jgi:hypothetical protein
VSPNLPFIPSISSQNGRSHLEVKSGPKKAEDVVNRLCRVIFLTSALTQSRAFFLRLLPEEEASTIIILQWLFFPRYSFHPCSSFRPFNRSVQAERSEKGVGNTNLPAWTARPPPRPPDYSFVKKGPIRGIGIMLFKIDRPRSLFSIRKPIPRW